MRATLLLVLILSVSVRGDDPTTAEGWLKRASEQMSERQFTAAIQSFHKCLELDRDNGKALHGRGCAHFLTSKFTESVADFDRFITLFPDQANGHWQRGISLYYAGKYDEGKKQFERYEKVSTTDVENAVWHFLCAAKKDSVAKARAGILKIGKDRRVPMMEVYDLFGGKLKPGDVLAAAQAGSAGEELRKQQLFYAHLYLGLYHDVNGEAKEAKEHLALAAEKYRISHYMGEVARVHHELLSKKK